MFIVRFPSGGAFFDGRKTKNNARFLVILLCVLGPTHGNYKTLSCVFLVAHGNPSSLTFTPRDRSDRLLQLTVVNLCRAPSNNARQRHQVCRAFVNGARQSYSIVVRFTLAHGNVFFKNEFSYLLVIFSSTSTLFFLSIFQLCNHIFLFANFNEFYFFDR
jgi:hypothetical protein